MLATSDIVTISVWLMDLLHVISIPFTLAFAKKHAVDQFNIIQKPRRIAVLICIIILLVLRLVISIVSKFYNIKQFKKNNISLILEC